MKTPLSHMTNAELVAYVISQNIKDPLVLELVTRIETLDSSVKS